MCLGALHACMSTPRVCSAHETRQLLAAGLILVDSVGDMFYFSFLI